MQRAAAIRRRARALATGCAAQRGARAAPKGLCVRLCAQPRAAGGTHLQEVGELRVAVDHQAVDVKLQLALLAVVQRDIVFGQAGAPLPVLQQDEANLGRKTCSSEVSTCRRARNARGAHHGRATPPAAARAAAASALAGGATCSAAPASPSVCWCERRPDCARASEAALTWQHSMAYRRTFQTTAPVQLA